MARKNKVTATITYYIPCTDKDNFAYGYRGQYVTVEGVIWNVDPDVTHSLTIGNQRIRFVDIVGIESHHMINGENIFERWEEYAS